MPDKLISTTFPVSGMSCAACAASVESMLKSSDGVVDAVVNYANASVQVNYNKQKTSSEHLRTAIQSIGYDLVIEEDEELKSQIAQDNKEKQYNTLKRQTIGAIVLSVPVVFISMFMPIFAGKNWILLLLSLPVVVIFGRGFYLRAIKQLRHKMVSMDTLVALSTGIALLFSIFNTLFPEFWASSGLEVHVYYEASTAIISFVLIGKWLEERAKTNTGKAIRKLIGLQPNTVIRVDSDNSQKTVHINEVSVGDILLVKPGDKIPIDGTVTSGSSFVDESMITGEPIAVEKSNGDFAYTGTINQQGSFTIKAERVGTETLLAQIIKMVQQAQGSKAPIQAVVDKIASYFVPTVIAISIITFISWMTFGGENALSYALITSISVLVIACPCALGLATPTAIIVGMGRGATYNILIKDAQSLEQLRKVDTIIFDKTGTLTHGKPKVSQLLWLKGANISDQSKILKTIESYSKHPLAQAVLEELSSIDALDSIDSFENITGRGVKAISNGASYFVGNRSLIEEQFSVLAESEQKEIKELANSGNTLVYFADQNQVLAIMAIADSLKENVPEVVETLAKHGYSLHLLTGDNQLAASSIANQSGIDQFKAEVMPHQKAEYIKQLQQNGAVVAMIGDGINDSEALALADVSIAMGGGSDIAIDVAQIILRSNDLALLPKAIALSQQTTKTINQNLFWAFIYNLIGIPIAAGVAYYTTGFLLNPMIAAAAMAFSSVSVVSNSLLLNRKKLRIKSIKNQTSTNQRKSNQMKTYNFKTNINCNGCIASVTPKLDAVEGLKHWKVDIDNPDKILTVQVDSINSEEITKAVSSAGFTIEETV